MKGVLYVIIVVSLIFLLDFMNSPEKYGDIMRRYDEARYHHIDCDCTETIE